MLRPRGPIAAGRTRQSPCSCRLSTVGRTHRKAINHRMVRPQDTAIQAQFDSCTGVQLEARWMASFTATCSPQQPAD
eukprot:13248-Heterococcus_DN1.PRE.2